MRRRKGLTFAQWLKRRRTDATPFDKFLIGIAEENNLRRYRDFICYFYDVYQKLPAYFDKSSPMCEANFQAALDSFVLLFEEFERVRYRGEYRTAIA